MHTFNTIISYILPKNYNFFFAIIISINNQTRMTTLKSVFNQNRVLLSFKHIYIYIYVSNKYICQTNKS